MGMGSELDFERSLAVLSSKQATLWGFRSGEVGTHTSRTIMLDEISQIFAARPGDASRMDYSESVVTDNCLGKKTLANRRISLQHLKELYGLDRRAILFRVFKELWQRHEAGRPLLALLLALARDPLLRATADPVVRTPWGHEFARQPIKDALSKATGERLNESTLDKVVRNAAASWTQSGHLVGRGRKRRQRVQPTPMVAAYSLLLGFAVGRRGDLLFETPWCAVLDQGAGELMDLAMDAKRLGLLDLKQSGSVIEVSFPTLLTGAERRSARGAHRHTG